MLRRIAVSLGLFALLSTATYVTVFSCRSVCSSRAHAQRRTVQQGAAQDESETKRSERESRVSGPGPRAGSASGSVSEERRDSPREETPEAPNDPEPKSPVRSPVAEAGQARESPGGVSESPREPVAHDNRVAPESGPPEVPGEAASSRKERERAALVERRYEAIRSTLSDALRGRQERPFGEPRKAKSGPEARPEKPKPGGPGSPPEAGAAPAVRTTRPDRSRVDASNYDSLRQSLSGLFPEREQGE